MRANGAGHPLSGTGIRDATSTGNLKEVRNVLVIWGVLATLQAGNGTKPLLSLCPYDANTLPL